ncbi:MAG TPA: UDP-N-acetylmuramate dehydrogenase [Bacteroidales bacterium]|jgi:UDP-N-acetylmuramate dehydrogenase|nr:UDP-N-acetylmuramate dehydrogenase [Bacteroidales bacterium]HOS73269.1 UDP-N-acetylmuramate dehydrogenase [Bacteroidales bacterium]HQH23477.1 UDP-N-acetylmuramate dehydrogenase [Bacteroidales bacterium]HQJ82053.1 UDP-N-acetylmuramate dehydrogenase [Bacteroidales bacterium]
MLYIKSYSLKKNNTFGIDCTADNFVIVHTEREAAEFFRKAGRAKEEVFIIGEGSNLLFTSDFHGTIVRSAIRGIRNEWQDDEFVIISAGSGIVWDSFVEWTVKKGYQGLENLSFIPGLTGAVPVQNIGAYGAEAGESVVRLSAVSTTDGTKRIFENHECGFGYRNSVFKNELKGKYLITRVFFRLRKNPHYNLDYGNLREEADRLGGPSVQNIRKAVIKIRRSRLPDPAVSGNAGSFFKNPVVSPVFAGELKKAFPGLPVYNDPSGGRKLAAGWLIEQCGWKGRRSGDAGVHHSQSLVLVNHGNATGADIYRLSEEIRKSVKAKYGLDLEREVEVLGLI